MTRRFTLALLLALVLPSCGDEPTLEQQIIGTINEMEQLAEEGKRGAFIDKVAGEFSGKLGLLSKDEFNRFMIMQWNRNNKLHAQLFPIAVRSLGPGMAAADFNGLITGGRGLLPERGQLFHFETTWLEEDGEWLLATANWEPVSMDAN